MASNEAIPASESFGYIKTSSKWILESRFFPSKVGGKPAWLNLSGLPNPEELQCGICQNPCLFLTQIYAPVEEKEECFHRTVFIFMCMNANCCKERCNQNFKVLRCQLPRHNDFYPFDPPVEEPNWRCDITGDKFTKLCFVCGCKGPKQCGQCKTINYCSREHQVIHWKKCHKNECGKGKSSENPNFGLLPEYQIEMGYADSESDTSSDNEEHNTEEYFQNDTSVDDDLEAMANSKEDKALKRFCERTVKDPLQVLRYDRDGDPLWPSDVFKPSEQDILKCVTCGSPRRFEFQILPQLLNHLKLTTVDHCIDWGTLAVYTCSESCDVGPAYKPEFLWKQDIVACE